MRAGSSQQRLGERLAPFRAMHGILCENAVTGKLPISNRFLNEMEFSSRKEWSIKWNAQRMGKRSSLYFDTGYYPRLPIIIPATTSENSDDFGEMSLLH